MAGRLLFRRRAHEKIKGRTSQSATDNLGVAMNPLKELLNYGQSFWLDYIRRGLISSGELQKHIVEDGLRGVTSNPAIFEKAITGSNDYAALLKQLEKEGVKDAAAIFERLAAPDIQDTADILRPI